MKIVSVFKTIGFKIKIENSKNNKTFSKSLNLVFFGRK